MRRLGSLLGLAGLVAVSCLVPDVELVESLPGAAGGGAGGKGSSSKGGSPAIGGTGTADAGASASGAGGKSAGGKSATDGGTAPVTDAGTGAGGDGSMILDDSALSCAALSKTACQGESCCSTLPVPACTDCNLPGGKTYRVSALRLDKYEVTVGRFRAFIEAYKKPPSVGAGAHPNRPDTGWLNEWNGDMLGSSAELLNAMQFRTCKSSSVRTWTNAPGANEQKPANCLTWYEAFAFCAWDGGFLPTELEWQHAATAGNEGRTYAWVGDTLDIDHALYGACDRGVSTACDLSSILEVGSKPAGAGKWGHLDLIGSVWEWILDSPSGEFPAAQPCDDCASLGVSSYRSIRGGSWPEDESYMLAARRNEDPATDGWYNIGMRCAHAP